MICTFFCKKTKQFQVVICKLLKHWKLIAKKVVQASSKTTNSTTAAVVIIYYTILLSNNNTHSNNQQQQWLWQQSTISLSKISNPTLRLLPQQYNNKKVRVIISNLN